MGRDSDRYVTPRVIVAALVLGTLVVLAVVASVTYLTARGLDPDPMLRLTAQVGGAVFSAGTFLLQLTGRKTQAKTERNVGRLVPVVVETLEELDARTGRHAAQMAQDGPAEYVEPIHPETRPHPLYGQNTAQAAERR